MKTTCTIVMILTIAALAVSASAAPKAEVLVQPSSDVAGEYTNLGDIAKLVTADAELYDKLAALQICRSPLAGSVRKITRNNVMIAVRRLGLTEGTVNVISPQEVTIVRKSTMVTGQAIFDAVEQYITSDVLWPGTVTVEPVRLPSDQNCPTGDVEIRVRPGIQKVRKGHGSLATEILVDGRSYTTVLVSFIVRLYGNVLVATRPIAKSDPITADNTIMRDMELTNLPIDLVTSEPGPDTIASSMIAEGTVIRQNSITTPPTIKSGEVVTVLVSGKFTRVTDRGTAAANGRVGDTIRVTMGDARQLRAVVVKPGLVEIALGGRS